MNEKQIAFAVETIVKDGLPFSHLTRPMRVTDIIKRIRIALPHFTDDNLDKIRDEATEKLANSAAPSPFDEPAYETGMMTPSPFCA